MSNPTDDRRSEWFVPTFGPLKLRIAVGLLFLPYTGMVLAFTVIGAMLAPTLVWSRVGAIVLIYFFGLGIAAHALDALGSGGIKPWGEHFSRGQLKAAALLALLVAYGIGLYYILFVTPWLGMIAVLEGFFLFAYNLEWFAGRFHTDRSFAFSWGVLPTLAGFVIQTHRLSIPAVIVAVAMGALSLVEINASRPYKEMKRRGEKSDALARYEAILKGVSLGVILMATGLALWRRSF
jgi:hypothetical protein